MSSNSLSVKIVREDSVTVAPEDAVAEERARRLLLRGELLLQPVVVDQQAHHLVRGEELAGARVALPSHHLRRVVAACRPDNEPSWRVMEHCGMTYVEPIQRWSIARRKTFNLSLYAINKPPA